MYDDKARLLDEFDDGAAVAIIPTGARQLSFASGHKILQIKNILSQTTRHG